MRQSAILGCIIAMLLSHTQAVIAGGEEPQPNVTVDNIAERSTLIVVGRVSEVKDVTITNEKGETVLHQQVVTVMISSVLKGISPTNSFVLISPVEARSVAPYMRGDAGVWFIAGFEKTNIASLVHVKKGFAPFRKEETQSAHRE